LDKNRSKNSFEIDLISIRYWISPIRLFTVDCEIILNNISNKKFVEIFESNGEFFVSKNIEYHPKGQLNQPFPLDYYYIVLGDNLDRKLAVFR
jgi:hypothetical protein